MRSNRRIITFVHPVAQHSWACGRLENYPYQESDPLLICAWPKQENTMKGFTLLEALIVLVIMSILTMLAVPAFGWMGNNAATKNSATNLQLAVMSARSAAVKFNRNASIIPKAGNWANGWDIVVVGKVVSTFDGTRKHTMTASHPAIEFTPNGRISDPEISIVMCGDELQFSRAWEMTWSDTRLRELKPEIVETLC